MKNPITGMDSITDGELNRFCAEEVMELEPIILGSKKWFAGYRLDPRGATIDYFDPLTNPTHNDLLLEHMAKKWCVEISHRSVTVDGIIIKRWDCSFWESNLKIENRNGAKHDGPDRKRVIVIAAWKAETGQFYKPQMGYNFLKPDIPLIFDDMHVSTEIRNLTPEEVRERLDKAAESFRNWLPKGEEE